MKVFTFIAVSASSRPSVSMLDEYLAGFRVLMGTSFAADSVAARAVFIVAADGSTVLPSVLFFVMSITWA